MLSPTKKQDQEQQNSNMEDEWSPQKLHPFACCLASFVWTCSCLPSGPDCSALQLFTSWSWSSFICPVRLTWTPPSPLDLCSATNHTTSRTTPGISYKPDSSATNISFLLHFCSCVALGFTGFSSLKIKCKIFLITHGTLYTYIHCNFVSTTSVCGCILRPCWLCFSPGLKLKAVNF